MRTAIAFLAMTTLLCTAATEPFDTGGGGAPPAPPEPFTPAPEDGFIDRPDSDPAQPGPDAEAAHQHYLATHNLPIGGSEPLPDGPPAGIEPGPARVEETEVVEDKTAAFDAAYPDFAEWFGRVQKTAQFNSQPIPEESDAFLAAFAAKRTPVEAAAELCHASGCQPQRKADLEA